MVLSEFCAILAFSRHPGLGWRCNGARNGAQGIPAYAGRALEGRGVGGDAYRIVPGVCGAWGEGPNSAGIRYPRRGKWHFLLIFTWSCDRSKSMLSAMLIADCDGPMGSFKAVGCPFGIGTPIYWISVAFWAQKADLVISWFRASSA